MSKLLTNKIALDTSFFEGQNFLVGSKIKELSELCNKKAIEIYLTDITYHEILSRFRKKLIETNEDIMKPIKLVESKARLLRNFSELKVYFDFPTIEVDKLFLRFQIALDEWLKNNNATIIATGHITIKEIFDDYFNNNPPFKEGNKKHEFPDAFTLKALVEYFSHLKNQSYILSTDQDILTFKSDVIIPIENASDLFNLVIRDTKEKLEKKAIGLIEKEYISSKSFLETEIKKKIINLIEDEIESTYQINDMDVDYGELMKISDIAIEEYSIVSLNISDNSGTLYCDLNFSFEVSFTVEDYSYASYDNEDGTWYGIEMLPINIQDSYDIPVTISVYFDTDEKFAELEVEEINNGNKFDFIGRYENYR